VETREPAEWPRPAAYATTELYLDLMFCMTRHLKCDADAVWIYMCVAHDTMRPYAENARAGDEILTLPQIPEEARAGISRRMIAEKTGLARETVRRRVAVLVNAGLLFEDADGRVRSSQPEDARVTSLLSTLIEIDGAVQNYNRRTAAYPRPWRQPLGDAKRA